MRSVSGTGKKTYCYVGIKVAKPLLTENYPNPFNPTTSIQFMLPKPDHVTLKAYNVLGQDVATLVNGQREAGSHVATFDASAFGGLAGGVYIYQLRTSDVTSTQKMLLVK